MNELKALLNIKLQEIGVSLNEENLERLWRGIERNLETWHKEKVNTAVNEALLRGQEEGYKRGQRDGYNSGYDCGYDRGYSCNPSVALSGSLRPFFLSFFFPLCGGLLLFCLIIRLLC